MTDTTYSSELKTIGLISLFAICKERNGWKLDGIKKRKSCTNIVLSGKRKTNKHKALWKKLANLTPEIKEKLIDLYLELCYERHRYKYFLWREYKLEKSNKVFLMGEALNDK